MIITQSIRMYPDMEILSVIKYQVINVHDLAAYEDPYLDTWYSLICRSIYTWYILRSIIYILGIYVELRIIYIPGRSYCCYM